MGHCKARWEDADNTGFELNCDLDNGHDPIMRNHYDALKKLYWHENEVPVAVPYTRTGPLKVLKEAA